MTNDPHAEELDELQDKLETEEEQQRLQEMKVDNRSIFTIKDTITKKSQPDETAHDR